MGIPKGFKFKSNLANYIFQNLGKRYIQDYGEDLENRYDKTDEHLYPYRIFCMDCPTFKSCKGKHWNGCPNRLEALKIIRKEI